jgi:hypothetical protein
LVVLAWSRLAYNVTIDADAGEVPLYASLVHLLQRKPLTHLVEESGGKFMVPAESAHSRTTMFMKRYR